jgi:uncharacterized repeat protein (TIGR01451 family)
VVQFLLKRLARWRAPIAALFFAPLPLVTLWAFAVAAVSPSSVSAQTGPVVNAKDYTSIQAALDDVRSKGGGWVYVPAGTHQLSAKLRLFSNTGIFGDGPDQTILTPSSTMDDHLMSDDSSSSHDTNITVRDITLRGPGRASAKTGCCHGARFVNIDNLKIINVVMTSHSKDGLYLGYYQLNGVTKSRVNGSRFEDNGRNGLSVTHGTEIIIDNTVIQNNNRLEKVAGLDFEPDVGANVANNIAYNVTAENTSGNTSQNVGIQLYSFDRSQATQGNNKLCKNTARYNSNPGIWDHNGNSNVYVNNVAHDNAGGNILVDPSAVFSTDETKYCQLPALPAAPQKPGSTMYALTVTKAGTGAGTVASSPSGIECGADCSESYASGTVVTLTATEAAGSAFGGWSGGCTNATGPCSVTMDAAKSVTATFNAATTHTLTVTKTGSGSGTVTSSPSGISCGADCNESYVEATAVTLTASAASGSSFGAWSGDCSGTGSSCTLTMNAAKSVSARFDSTVADLSVTKSDSPDPVRVGNNLTYTLTITNNGPAAATGVTVTDTIPKGVSFVSATSSQGSCTRSSRTVTCSMGTLANAAQATATIVVNPTKTGSKTNKVTVNGQQTDPSSGNNAAQAVTTVTQ